MLPVCSDRVVWCVARGRAAHIGRACVSVGAHRAWQASSIQNLGITCESFTLGHNPFDLPLSTTAIHLPRLRPQFISEYMLESYLSSQSDGRTTARLSASALMGLLGTMDIETFADVEPPKARHRPPPPALARSRALWASWKALPVLIDPQPMTVGYGYESNPRHQRK